LAQPNIHLADFGDWKEWNYYPYGPIVLHGIPTSLTDVAEATGRLDSDRVERPTSRELHAPDLDLNLSLGLDVGSRAGKVT
jgi:hypothetical protein